MISVQKLTVKIEVTGGHGADKLRICKSCQSVFKLLACGVRGVVSVYYGNVIAEAGPWSAAPVCSQVHSLRLAFCSTSLTEMSSLSLSV